MGALWIPSKFTKDELACKLTGKIWFEDGFLERLEQIRTIYDIPMIVTSGCRSPEHNKAIGGHPRSLHMYSNMHYQIDAIAVDIKRDGTNLSKLMKVGLQLGWSFGIAKTFIHMDLRTLYLNLPQRVFTYD